MSTLLIILSWVGPQVVLAPTPKSARPEGWIGQQVFVKQGGNAYGQLSEAGQFTSQGVTRYIEYKVLAEKGDFIQISEDGKEVWVRKDCFVLLSDAVRFFSERIENNPNDDRAFAFRAWAWKKRDQLDKAIEDYTKAIELDPREPDWYNNRGMLYNEKKEYSKALDDFSKVLQLNPQHHLTLRNRADTYIKTKEYAKAIDDFEAAFKINDRVPYGYEGLARLLATCPEEKFRNGKRAVELGIKGCELTQWKDGDALDALAAAYAEIGDFDKAVETQAKALTDADYLKQKGTKARKRLQLYRDKKPFRDDPDAKEEDK